MEQELERGITRSTFPMAGGGLIEIKMLGKQPSMKISICRVQHVNYHTNDHDGYVAEVTYGGHHGAIGGHGGHLAHGGFGGHLGFGGHGVP